MVLLSLLLSLLLSEEKGYPFCFTEWYLLRYLW